MRYGEITTSYSRTLQGGPSNPRLEAQRRFTVVAQGVHPRAIMELLGHSSIIVTMNVYGHVLPAMMREAADKMEELLEART